MTPRAASLFLPLALAACADPQPVATLTVEPRELQLAYPHSAPMSIAWEPLVPLDRQHGKALVMVHLIDPNLKDPRQAVRRTFDHALPESWIPGKAQRYEIDLYQSALVNPLPPGEYLLTIGLYDDSWGYRWPLDVDGEEFGEREYRMATVRVPEPEGGAHLIFSKGWGPAIAVADVQTLVQRRLGKRGTLTVADIDGPGAVRVSLLIDEPGGGIKVINRCNGADGRVEGVGIRRAELEILPRPDQTECQLVFLRETTARDLTVHLRTAAWRAANGRGTTR